MTSPSGHPSTALRPRTGFRRDIQGLRAIAVVAVVVFHAVPALLPGGYIGVDVFFVISGFLITSQLLRQLDSAGTFSLREFYARRIRRLLPAALLVLAVTLVVAAIVLPSLMLREVGNDAIATALAGSNYWFALSGTDYLADEAPSLFQHYWSLAVEEQFYFVWPLILLGLWRLRAGNKRHVTIALGAIVVASFVYCVVLTAHSQPWAFFGLPTRAWELGVGALVAIGAPFLRTLPRRIAALLGWVGVAGVAACVALFTEQLAFPGWVAALPVTATALVIIGGIGARQAATDPLLGSAPFQYLGRISYSLYLWHWPVLVFAALLGGPERSAWVTVLLVAACVALADLTHRWVENPVRKARGAITRKRATFGVAASLTVAVIVGGSLTAASAQLDIASSKRAAEPTALAASDIPAPEFVPSNLTPTFEDVAADVPPVYGDGCQLSAEVTVSADCTYGPATSDLRVVLLGDSHAAQWFPALLDSVDERGGQLQSLTKSGCPIVDVPVTNEILKRDYTECEQWRTHALERVGAFAPDLIVVSSYGRGYRDLYTGGGDFDIAWSSGMVSLLDALPETSRVVVLGDTPHWGEAPTVCLSENIDSPANCGKPVDELTDASITAAERSAVDGRAGDGRAGDGRAAYVDTVPLMCAEECHGIYGNILGYRDADHITATFARHLGPRLWSEIEAVVPGI